MDGDDTTVADRSTEVLVDEEEDPAMQIQDQHKAAGDQEVQQASIEAIPPPTVGMKFETFEAARKYYQS